MELPTESNKKLFAKTPSHITTLAFLFLVSVIIMTMDYRHKKLELVRTWLGSALYPVYLAADLPIRFSEWLATFFSDKNLVLKQNRELNTENLFLKKQLQKVKFIENENSRLRAMLKMSSTLLKDDVQIAEIVYIKPNLSRDEIALNKGLIDGVYIGQPVLNTEGVIGQVIHANLKTSSVLLITSTRHAIPVQINRNLYRSMAHGNGHSKNLMLKRVIADIEIEVGDLVETSGVGGVFPPGYPVGIIDKVLKQQDQIKVEVKPYINQQPGREVLLIWPPKN